MHSWPEPGNEPLLCELAAGLIDNGQFDHVVFSVRTEESAQAVRDVMDSDYLTISYEVRLR